MINIDEQLNVKYQRLRSWFEEAGSVLVAYSGGTDSALVLKVAHDVLGPRCVAVTASSASLPRAELDQATAAAKEIGARHVIIESREVEDPRYRENTEIRCYFCKSDVYDRLVSYASEHGYTIVADGTNADDLEGHRPGLKAARERGVKSPLSEVGLTKDEIREISRALGLSTWDKPAAACLSSRIPYGTSVSPDLLRRVEEGEAVLRRLGIRQIRLRHHGVVARIEVEPSDFGKVLEHREEIARALRPLGYRYVTLDLEGFRSGSLNASLGRK